MSDTFYLRQMNGGTTAGKRTKPVHSKPKRRLKKDIIAEINQSLGKDITGLDKCTIATLDELLGAINERGN